jgi:membrane peptidoglycan carboxypeptidase
MYSKSEILEMYFNQIYYGHGAYGIQAASRTYFAKDVRQLTLPEAALLAGLPQNPSGHSPYRNPKNALSRRTVVLRNMLETKTITQGQYDSAVHAPLGIVDRPDGVGQAPYFVEMVRQALDDKYGSNLVYEGGLRIYTSLDLDLQREAERSLEKRLSDLETRYKYRNTRGSFAVPAATSDGKAPVGSQTPYVQGALVALDVKTGYVRALVGGRDFRHSSFNRATQAKRQPGSSFKPFVLVTALKDGISLKSRYDGHSPKDFPGRDPVQNFGPGKGEQFGQIDLVTATAHSVNTVYYQLGLDAGGPSKVIDTAKAAGITSDIDPAKAATNVFLGSGDTVETNSLQMADAYATFAAQGKHATPYLVQLVREGKKQIYKAKDDTDQAFDKDVMADATYAMEHVLTEGTARSAQLSGGRPAAGKTGTVQENTDAWFCGYVPQLAGAVHIYRDGTKPLRNLGGYNEVTGGTLPAKIWKAFMDAAMEGEPVKDFPPPAYVGEAKNPAPTATATATSTPTPTPIATLPTSVPTQAPTLPPVKPTKGGGGGSPTPQPSATPQPSTSP